MTIEFSPRFQVKNRKLQEWQAAEQMGSPQTKQAGAKTVIKLDELIAAQVLAQRASGDGA